MAGRQKGKPFSTADYPGNFLKNSFFVSKCQIIDVVRVEINCQNRPIIGSTRQELVYWNQVLKKMITCSTTPSLHNSQAIIFAQLSRSAFLTILEHGTGYIQSHTDFLYSLVCTVRYRNGLDARCILSASAIVLLGFIQICGRFISHLSRGHNEVQNENWRLPSFR